MPWKFKNLEGRWTFLNYWITTFFIDGATARNTHALSFFFVPYYIFIGQLPCVLHKVKVG